MRVFLVIVAMAAAVLLALPYLVLPPLLEGIVARNVQDRLGLAERPAVDLESEPQWEMLLGQFSGGKISVGEADLGGVRAENVSMNLDPFDVDVGRSVRREAAVVEGPVSGRVRVTVSEEEVSRLAAQNADVPVNGVELRRDGVTVESEATFLGITIPVSVDGGVGVDGNALVFRPAAVRAAGTTVPEDLADSLLAGTAFRYPVGNLPYGAEISDAETVEGAVVLTGRVSGIERGG